EAAKRGTSSETEASRRCGSALQGDEAGDDVRSGKGASAGACDPLGGEAGGPADPGHVGGCEAPSGAGGGGGDRWRGVDRESNPVQPAGRNDGDPGLLSCQPACASGAANGVR